MSGSFPQPPDERRCSALNKRGGRCKSWVPADSDTGKCVAHDPARQTLVMRDPAAAQARSQRAKDEKRKQAENEAYIRSQGIREQVRLRIESRSSQIVDRLMELAMDHDPAVSLRAIDALWNRSYGRPLQPSVQANVGVDRRGIEELRQALAQLDPETRRQVARRQLGLVKGDEDADVA